MIKQDKSDSTYAPKARKGESKKLIAATIPLSA